METINAIEVKGLWAAYEDLSLIHIQMCIRDSSVDQLKFKPKRRRDHVKLTAQELKELSALEDKGGKSKIDDAKSVSYTHLGAPQPYP